MQSDAAKTGCPNSPAISMPLFKLPFGAKRPTIVPVAGQVQLPVDLPAVALPPFCELLDEATVAEPGFATTGGLVVGEGLGAGLAGATGRELEATVCREVAWPFSGPSKRM